VCEGERDAVVAENGIQHLPDWQQRTVDRAFRNHDEPTHSVARVEHDHEHPLTPEISQFSLSDGGQIIYAANGGRRLTSL